MCQLADSVKTQLDLLATCAFGLEAVVRRELDALNFASEVVGPGRVQFRGDLSAVALANLHLRCGDRVLIRVSEFPAADFETLFETVRSISWGEWLPLDATFPVSGRSVKSTLHSVPAVQRSVKRAVVDAMRRDHRAAELPETGPSYRIDVALLSDIATLTIDTTGSSLQRRGYRQEGVATPLKETLAAAMVLLSFWRSGRPLIDPFCGTGTVPIEAARIGRNIAAGIDRDFVFASWTDAPEDLLEDLKSTARAAQQASLDERIIGSDISGRVLHAARDNAQRAGVVEDIHFERKDVRQLSSKRRFGCLICHPPQLRQPGPDRELDELHRALPNVFRRLPTWSHYVLTGYPRFEHVIGKPADRRRKLYNGPNDNTYYQYHGPKPVVETKSTSDGNDMVLTHADGTAAFGQLDAKAAEQAELFANRLRKRARHLRRWPTRRSITCFRLYERDVPEIPFVVDRYEDHLHITEYDRPHDRDPAQHANWVDLMMKTAGETLDVPPERLHLKRRDRDKHFTQYEKLDQTGNRIVVHEGGLKFWVNLDDYVDTGLFLDHRNTRSMVREAAKDTWFLNLFAYTGSFTAYAIDGGARKTTSVDLSKTYTDWTGDNLRLNGFLTDESESKHELIAMDVEQFIQQHPPGERYELVVLDPPTYSRSKRTEKDWNVQQDAIPLLNKLLPLVRKGGLVFFSNNFRRFKFDPEALDISQCHEISAQTVPEDFRNRRIHRCWRIVR